MLSSLLTIALALLAFVLWILWRRADLYLYSLILGVRVPVRVGRVLRDGTFLDLTKPRGARRVGQVLMQAPGQATVVLYRTDGVTRREVAVGTVSTDGLVTPEDAGDAAARVDPDGRRRWWDAFLRLHARVPMDAVPPLALVREWGRFRRRHPGEVTLLARGGAALLLYRAWGPDVESARLAPSTKWDLALPAALLFVTAYSLPAVQAFTAAHAIVLPILGPRLAYLATALSVYGAIWLAMVGVKVAATVDDDRITDVLTLLNRETGIRGWSGTGAAIAGAGLITCLLLLPLFRLSPIFASALIAFSVSLGNAPAGRWGVSAPRPPLEHADPIEAPPSGPNDTVRRLRWRLDSAFREVPFAFDLRFAPGEIDAIRGGNPFHLDARAAAVAYPESAKVLVESGRQHREVRRLVAYVASEVERQGLGEFDRIQAVLDLAQEPTITYALDGDCPELGVHCEYCRFPAETLHDLRGDCDCKTTLAAAVLRELGFPVLGFYSNAAEHAALAVGGAPPGVSDEEFFTFERDGVVYYYCETTGEGWRVGQAPDNGRDVVDDPNALVVF